MAKLKAPLLSLGAAGAIGKTIVFFNWKGVNAAREYIVPANPKTSGQTTQRGYLTAVVAAIHAALGLAANPLDEDDKVAYALLGSTHATPRTWFNEIAKRWLDCKVATKVPVIYRDGKCQNTSTTAIDLVAFISEETGSQLAAGKWYIGTSKTSLIHSVVATITAGSHVFITLEDLSAWMTAGVKYFFQFRPDSGDPCEGADSGIYSFVAT